MAISDSVSRMAASLLSLLRNRLELAAVEFEEEALRLFSFLLSSLIALFFVGVSVTLLVVLVLVLFWDDHRVAALLGMVGVFGAIGVRIGLLAQRAYKQKPPMMSDTINELNKDMASLRAAASPDSHPHQD